MSLNILVIGTGMYTCGTGTHTHGTVMPAVFEWKRRNLDGEIYVAGTGPESLRRAHAKISELQSMMHVNPSIRYFPEGGNPDPGSYLKAIQKVPKPGCVIIATPDHLHREMAGAAIEAGLHTLVVKPLAPTLREVRELIEGAIGGGSGY